jgi:hypothetical protein
LQVVHLSPLQRHQKGGSLMEHLYSGCAPPLEAL